MPPTAVDNVIIPFLRSPGPSDTPNLRESSGSEDFTSYDECIVVTCAALRRFNPDISIKLATNVPVDGRLRVLLDDLGVVSEVIPFTRSVPPGFAVSFSATLYYLDVVAHVPSDGALLLDPDVLCIRSIGALDCPSPDLAMVFPIAYPSDYVINGLSRREAARIHEALDGTAGLPEHFGGEFYYIPGCLVQQVSERLDTAWADALLRFDRGLPYFVTEEHFFSYALRPLGPCSPEFGIKRIWTTLRQRNVSGDEGLYALWHLPSEKGRGFHAMFQCAIDKESWFWLSSSELFLHHAGVAMGLHNRPPLRFIMESLVGTVHEAIAKSRGIERCP
ncbi:hypothetical protein [Kocuria rosea]|uniref:hypothetical protein n=1 Tax=Kocuria rosea TaxID=1275 RepID=UPI000F70032F|nr:hypothetical protein [Kocuria rosea]VEI50354.1 Uncharacterised protein [Kocuria rosea]